MCGRLMEMADLLSVQKLSKGSKLTTLDCKFRDAKRSFWLPALLFPLCLLQAFACSDPSDPSGSGGDGGEVNDAAWEPDVLPNDGAAVFGDAGADATDASSDGFNPSDAAPEVGCNFRRNPVDPELRQRLLERGIDPDVCPGITPEARAILASKDLNQRMVYEAMAIDACSCKTRSCYGNVTYAYTALIQATPPFAENDPVAAASRAKARACHDALPFKS